MSLKLFAVYLGGRAPKCNTELHDVVFVVGETIEHTYPQLLEKWFGSPERLHIDSWVELNVIDGHRVVLKQEPRTELKKLYFINMGGYRPGEFSELHANAFLVAANQDEVKRRAKAELLVGMSEVHKDDLFDLDDCLEVREINGVHVHLEPTTTTTSLEVHSEYHMIPKAVIAAYMEGRSVLL